MRSPDLMPRVSVVMPVFNVDRYLPAAVESILAQTLKEFELIAVDDGSTDSSLEILQRYAAQDSRVRILSRANTGIVGALNDGLAMCRAPLVARMDGDDISLPRRLEKQVAFLAANPDHVVVGCQVLLTYEGALPICPKKDTRFTHEEIDQAHLHSGWPLTHGTVMMRRDALQRVGGYREKYKWLEDLDLFLRLAEIGRLGNLPDVLYHYLQRGDSICWTRQEEQLKVRRELYRETRIRRGLAASDASVSAQVKHHANDETLAVWAWWALREKHICTARALARKVLFGRPLSKDSWRLAACALRGH